MPSPNQIARMVAGGLAIEAKQVYLTVKVVLDRFFLKTPITPALIKKIYHYQIGYVNLSKEHVDFFGSNLLGVHVIRFRESDVLRFFNEVIDVDYDDLKQAIRETETINHTYKVSGDIFNLTLMYLVHRFLSETKLSEYNRWWGAYNTALIFFYRAIAAMLSAWFKFPADPKVAQAAYAALSNKFLIKQLGSWHDVMDYRANALVSKTGTQYNKLLKLKTDEDLVDVINDSANAIKDMLKNYYAEFAKAHSQGSHVGVTYATGFDIEGEEVVRDKIRKIDGAVAEIKHLLGDPQAFIRDDLISVIVDINGNTSMRLLKETLQWMCGHARASEFKLIDHAVTKIVIYSFHLIQTRIEPDQIGDLGHVLVTLKNLYLSSRSTDPDLIEIRELVDKILDKAHKRISQPLRLATRTATVLYISLVVLVGRRNTGK